MDDMEPIKPAPVYTLFSYYHANFIDGSEDRNGELIELGYMHNPNDPRACMSLDGMQSIVTGIFDFPGAVHITQQEAETLIKTKAWHLPETDNDHPD